MSEKQNMLENIKQQPLEQRQRLVWFWSVIVMMLVITIWVVTLKINTINGYGLSDSDSKTITPPVEAQESISDLLDEQAEFEKLLQDRAEEDQKKEAEAQIQLPAQRSETTGTAAESLIDKAEKEAEQDEEPIASPTKTPTSQPLPSTTPTE